MRSSTFYRDISSNRVFWYVSYQTSLKDKFCYVLGYQHSPVPLPFTAKDEEEQGFVRAGSCHAVDAC